MRFNREDLEDVVFWVFIFLLNWSTFRRGFDVPIWQIVGEVAPCLAIWFCVEEAAVEEGHKIREHRASVNC